MPRPDLRGIMRRRDFIRLLGGAALGLAASGRTRTTRKIPRIGFMGNSTAALEANLVRRVFREDLSRILATRKAVISSLNNWADGRL